MYNPAGHYSEIQIEAGNRKEETEEDGVPLTLWSVAHETFLTGNMHGISQNRNIPDHYHLNNETPSLPLNSLFIFLNRCWSLCIEDYTVHKWNKERH
jgi:hypothetical protein